MLFVLLIVSEVAFVARQASGQESAQSNVEELVRKLGSDFYGDRQSAQMALAEKGAAVEDVMLKLLQESDDDSIRVAAISLLSRMNSRKAVPLLIELLEKSTRVTLRKAAIEGLSRYEPDSFSSLMEDYENLNESMKKFVVKLVEKMLIEHTKKQFHGGTFIIFPGQFDKFKKIRKAAGAAMRRLLEEWDSLEPEVLDPRALPILIAAAGDLKMEETKDVLRKMFDEGEPEADDAAAVSLALMGDRSRFDSLVKQYKEMAQEDSFAYATLAHLYHQVRDYKEAEGYYKKMLEVTPDSSIRANYACLLSISGREKEALAEMRKALATGLAAKEWILYDGELENMRKLPEFKKLAEEYGLVLEEKEEK
ncbi:MAG: HEAT repeat domain-containing protein [Planctomycetota bacterium]|nr:HEAT repeat domain-containing protein [Planctomycetota bacterium]